MRKRYLALIASSGAPALDRSLCAAVAAKCPELAKIGFVGDACFFLANCQTITFERGKGFVVGTLFRRDGRRGAVQQVGPPDDDPSHDPVENLLSRYWGGYVAFLSDPAGKTLTILRDPSGFLPCYYVLGKGVVVVASDIELLIRSGFLSPQVDWVAISAHLLADHHRSARTSLIGVTELLGGEALVAGPQGIELKQAWNPWDFTPRSSEICDARVARQELRRTVEMCVAEWAREFRHIAIGVSGGLDSSIVAACVHSAGVPLSCLTLATKDPSGDERTYARLVAGAFEATLTESIEDIGEVDLSVSAAAHLPRPVARAFAQAGNRKFIELARRTGADAFFSGAGGDNVFCALQSVAPLADRLLRGSSIKGLWQSARDISRLSDHGVPLLLALGFRRAWFRDAQFRWPRDQTFLTGNCIDAGESVGSHPHLFCPPGTLPGKAAHIAQIIGIQNHLEGFERELSYPNLAPLMSQPIIELCLRIPTWLWCSGGINRAPARGAFADRLPPELITRQLKGSPGSFLYELFAANRRFIRELLADGLLARQDIIDRDAVVRAIDDPRAEMTGKIRRIMSLVDVEVWAGSWSRPPSQATGSTGGL